MAADRCIKCGSYAFNLYKEGIDQGGFCDVHYWQGRAHRAEALAEQPAQQEPEIVQRVKRYAGQTMRTARNPNITARECIELANWITAANGIKENT